MSKGKKKEKNPQIEVRTFNWGPCVIKLKIQDDFKKALLSEIKKSSENYNHKLAGQIEKEIGYTQESRDALSRVDSGLGDTCLRHRGRTNSRLGTNFLGPPLR